jgi:ABC-type transport system involved in multi-copper enzyme maturation permease subunit
MCYMTSKRKLFLIFTPSSVSLATGILLALLYAAITSVVLAQNSGRFVGFSIKSYLEVSHLSSLGSLLRSFFSSFKLNGILSIVFWVLIGFITYNVLFLLRGSVDESVSFWKRLHYIHAKPALLSKKLVARLFLLIFSLSIWVMFALLFSWFLLPIALNDVSKTITDGRSVLWVLLGSLIILGSSHVAVILLRFTLLRARISGDS